MGDLLDQFGGSDVVREPELGFDFDADLFSISGEAYPETGRRFFDEKFAEFFRRMDGRTGAEIRFTFSLTYYNSGSAHFLAHLVDYLDQLAAAGNTVDIVWQYYEDDDSMLDSGEEFAEDVEHANFTLQELTDGD